MRIIEGYEGKYKATRCGKIWSSHKKDFLSPKVDKWGYEVVSLYKNGKSKSFLVHRLIALTFLRNPNNLPTVNHIDGNKTNNNVRNLEWLTVSDNHIHAYKTGLRCNKGINSKFKENDIREIRRLYNDGIHVNEIAEKYSVVPGTIYNIVSYRNWKHVI